MAEKVNMPSQKKEKKKKRKKKLPSDFYDYNLLACTILLVSFGLIMLYSASAYEAASTFKGMIGVVISRIRRGFLLLFWWGL